MYPISRHSQGLHLRELRPDDAEDVFAIYGDARATEHMSFDPRTREDVQAIVARSIASAAADQEYALAVAGTDDGRLIGFGRLALDPHQPRAATFGFALNPGTWGNGFGTETVRLLLACALRGPRTAPGLGSPLSPQHRLRPHHGARRVHRGGAASASTSNAAASGATRSPTPSSTTNTPPSQSSHGSRYCGAPAGWNGTGAWEAFSDRAWFPYVAPARGRGQQPGTVSGSCQGASLGRVRTHQNRQFADAALPGSPRHFLSRRTP
ncbi:GNAT family N-acetyltransferase [Streptomyces sp. CB02115]|uniref:GNAT family N-acetyltransferase n=1 Tax=Streptomyces sp. CB02115 TaxID=1703939 RepID=UPI0026BA0E09